ncbi:MAG: DNA recombination protein RmuC [Candidatus Omnitrophica bacterium]|nr:DNA recombination protein RmuC [Candidatus Omnitrophota bacterium]
MSLLIVMTFCTLVGLVLWIFLELKKVKRAPLKEELLKETDTKLQALREEWGKTLDRNTQLISTLVQQTVSRIDTVSNQVGSRLDNAARVVGDVKQQLGALEQANQQIYEIGKHIALLQEELRAPKFRGEMGEFLLENLLANVMPQKEFYTLQYEFKSRQKVDAVLHIGNRLVPVDAKFPLEAFQRLITCATETEKKAAKKEFTRAVKDKIDEIAAKYILPDEGTYDFAMMYIPAENVYYETITKDENFGDEKSLLQYALSKKVIPVSPNTFYAYLKVILLGLKGLAIEKGVQEIIETLVRLRGDFEKFQEDFSKIGKHLTDSKASYDNAERRLEKFGDKLNQIESAESDAVPLKIPDKI